MKLLTDGKEAFPEILKCIDEAEKTIFINMFIWRGDEIGCAVASALLRAADRGVEVHISVDRYGLVLEKCEECTHSFFHQNTKFGEWLKIFILKIFYPNLAQKSPPKETHLPLLKKILEHPKITVSRDVFKADHSKYYVFDEKTLIFGGINIEDKENGSDISGRRYQDYMVSITDEETVKSFRLKLEKNADTHPLFRFTVNNKTTDPWNFEAEETLLGIINQAEKELLIIMAYFSPLPRFIEAIELAWQRGVKITLVIPQYANFQNDLNRKTVKKLMQLCRNEIELYLFKGMVHTKLLQNEKTLSFGSCNITKKAFGQLAELNLTANRTDGEFFRKMTASIGKTIKESIKVSHEKEIRFNGIRAIIEGFLV